MKRARNEEQFPLLFFLVGNDQQLSTTNKAYKSRLNGITSGASALITEWPNYVSSCWTTSLIITLTLFLMTLMLFTCFNMDSMRYARRFPRCTDPHSNRSTVLHLVASNTTKLNAEQMHGIETLLKKYPKYEIHLVLMTNFERLLALPHERTNNSSGWVFIDRIVEIVQNQHENWTSYDKLNDLQKTYRNFRVFYRSYDEVFSNSPLFMNWMMFDEKMRIFSVRVLQIWQYGGISLDLFDSNLTQTINDMGAKYGNLSEKNVWIDLKARRMGTKVPCHAFFGNVLNKLAKIGPNFSVEMVLKSAFAFYCRTNLLIDDYDNYCSRLKNKLI